MAESKFYVKIARPVFETVVVEVSADGYDQAIENAFEAASLLDDSAWQGEFDKSEYGFDVTRIVHAKDEEAEDFLSTFEDDTKYLLLKADVDSGEGEVRIQPWLHGCSSLMIADLAKDWGYDIEELKEEGIADFYDELEDEIEALKKPKVKAVVIPFPKNKK